MTVKNSNLEFILDVLKLKQSKIVTAIDREEVLRLLRVNRIPLLAVKNNETHFFHEEDFRKELMKEKTKYDRWRNEYGIVNERFLNEGIKNILFKSRGLSPSFPYTSDNLDVLVKFRHERKAGKTRRK